MLTQKIHTTKTADHKSLRKNLLINIAPRQKTELKDPASYEFLKLINNE